MGFSEEDGAEHFDVRTDLSARLPAALSCDAHRRLDRKGAQALNCQQLDMYAGPPDRRTYGGPRRLGNL